MEDQGSFIDSNKSSDKHSEYDYRNENEENDNASQSQKSHSQASESRNFDEDISQQSDSNKTDSKMSNKFSANNDMDESGNMNYNQYENDNPSEQDELDGDDEDASYDDEDDEEYRQDAEILDQIMPERKNRFRITNFINKMRANFKLPDFHEDFLGNQAAMIYAAYLMSEKENEIEFTKILTQVGFVDPQNVKVSTFTSYVDMSLDNGNKEEKFDDFSTDFMDCHSTLLEFEQHRNNLLGLNYNTMCVGMAFDKEKITVVDIFVNRLVNVEQCAITEESQTIFVEGKVLTDKYGVYAVRIVAEDQPNTTILSLNPQEINYDAINKKWICKFKNANNVFVELGKDDKKLFIQVYLRENPESIKYGQPTTDKIKFNLLTLGYRCQLENFPHPLILKEQEEIKEDELQSQAIENARKKEEETAEREERNRRENKFFVKKDDGLNRIDEESDDVSMSDGKSSKFDRESKKKGKEITLSDRSEDSIPTINVLEGDRKEPYDEQLNILEKNIDELKRDNEDLQRRIAIIFEFKKIENKDEKKHYKESNISESTYHDTLTTAANLYNDLSTHRKKLEADLLKYEQSIKIQEDRKKEVYKILMNYKEELINNAEDRKGAKIPPFKIQTWLSKEKKYEEEIKILRIENIKNTLLLNRYNKELKKTEEYFEGLHYIDFEQLKIENNTLTEKIEDLNEEIHKLKNTINSNVQILAHTQEKYKYVNEDTQSKEKDLMFIRNKVRQKKEILKTKQANHEKKSLKNYNEKKRIDDINSKSLISYYKGSYSSITEIYANIQQVIFQLSKIRSPNNMKDIKMLQKHAEKLFNEEYKKLIVFENNDRVNN